MEKSTEFDGKLIAPFNMVVAGATTSGKSRFVKNLIINYQHVMKGDLPKKFYWTFNIFDDSFIQIKENIPNLTLVEGIENLFTQEDIFEQEEPCCVVIDDLGQQAANSEKLQKLFSVAMHHKKITVILILQNLYQQGKVMRNLTLNAQYLVLFRNVRDINQIKLLQRQTGLNNLVNAYLRATREPYSPLLVDLKPHSPDEYRLRSNIIPPEHQKVYMKENGII